MTPVLRLILATWHPFSELFWQHETSSPTYTGNMTSVLLLILATWHQLSYLYWQHDTSSPTYAGNMTPVLLVLATWQQFYLYWQHDTSSPTYTGNMTTVLLFILATWHQFSYLYWQHDNSFLLILIIMTIVQTDRGALITWPLGYKISCKQNRQRSTYYLTSRL